MKIVCIALALALWPSLGRAGAPDAVALKKAQTYVDLGTDLFKAKDYSGALEEFRRALPLVV